MAADLFALVAFAAVTTGSPGPNNVILWATGVRFGTRQALPHVAGTGLGVAAMGALVAVGVGAVATVPYVALTLKVAATVYLLYLAYRMGAGSVVRQAAPAAPMGLARATAFQLVNPKVWVFVLAALAGFRPAALPVAAASVEVVAVIAVVAVATAAVWAAAGTLISQLVRDEHGWRVVNLVLAGLLLATVVLLWL